ncbi:MAG TPA: hypothetical protein VNZ58_02220 [Thermomicrobiales bacterium]|nr:hypothetical protein [Thermomicrobiales bacterium]
MAIQITAGEPIRSWFAHRPGRTMTVAYTERSDGTHFDDTLTLTDLGNGVYRLDGDTSTDDPHGEWYVLVEADDGTRFDQHFDVLPIPAYYDKVW